MAAARTGDDFLDFSSGFVDLPDVVLTFHGRFGARAGFVYPFSITLTFHRRFDSRSGFVYLSSINLTFHGRFDSWAGFVDIPSSTLWRQRCRGLGSAVMDLNLNKKD